MSLDLDRSTWQRVKLSDLVRNVNEYFVPERDGVLPFVAGPHIDMESAVVSRWGSTDAEDFPPTFKRLFQPGDVLLHSRGVEKVASVDRAGVTGEKLFVLRTLNADILDQRLLVWLLRSPMALRYFEANFSGSVNKFLNWKPLAAFHFDLPPLDQQRRIAHLLWSTEDLAASGERLCLSLEAVRESILDEHASRAPSKRLAELAVKVSDGPFGSKIKTEHYSENPGVRVIRLQDIGLGQLHDHDVAWLRDEHVEENLSGYRLSSNDVLVAGLGDERNPVGRAAPATDVGGAVHKADIFRVIVRSELLSAPYLMNVMNSPSVQRKIRARSQGTTRLRINTKNIREVLVPCAAPPEQHALMAKLEQLDGTVRFVDSELRRCAELKDSILSELAP